MTRIMNMTPHTINFVTEDGAPLMAVEPSGTIARVSVKTETIGEIAGIPVTKSVYSDIVDLPAPQEGVVYVVSSLVAQRCVDRDDVYIPNESVRDNQGRIIGCKSLGKVDGMDKETAAHLLGFYSADAAWVAMMHS